MLSPGCWLLAACYLLLDCWLLLLAAGCSCRWSSSGSRVVAVVKVVAVQYLFFPYALPLASAGVGGYHKFRIDISTKSNGKPCIPHQIPGISGLLDTWQGGWQRTSKAITLKYQVYICITCRYIYMPMQTIELPSERLFWTRSIISGHHVSWELFFRMDYDQHPKGLAGTGLLAKRQYGHLVLCSGSKEFRMTSIFTSAAKAIDRLRKKRAEARHAVNNAISNNTSFGPNHQRHGAQPQWGWDSRRKVQYLQGGACYF